MFFVNGDGAFVTDFAFTFLLIQIKMYRIQSYEDFRFYFDYFCKK